MQLSPQLTDHAVIQRHQPIPVTGTTSQPRARIRASLADAVAEGISGDDGLFELWLPALPAGGPHCLVVEALDGANRAEAKDILVGEVWLASGQSNMQMLMQECDYEKEIAAACPGQIRMFTVNCRADLAPQSNVLGKWCVAGPETMGQYSAVGNFFGQRLQDELDVPVGVICSSWGGTFIQTWTSRESLLASPLSRKWTLDYEQKASQPESWREREPDWFLPPDPGNEGLEKGWHQSDFNDLAWQAMELPGTWQNHGHAYSGIFWFRIRVALPETMRGKALTLNLGAVDKADITYVNGQEVGRTGEGFDITVWNQPRTYTLPAELTDCEELVIAVRAYSFSSDGGMIGPAEAMQLVSADGEGEGVSLAGPWRYQVEQNFGLIQTPMGHEAPNSPHILYDNMIRPLQPLGLAGVIWYQGESNDRDLHYAERLRTLIADWRFHFGLPDLPFGIVQLTSFTRAKDFDPRSNWARIREAQQDALALPRVGLAVTLDAGDAEDIHPKDKRTVGERLARWAMHEVYGASDTPMGPLYRSHRVEGDRIRVLFDHVGSGLSLSDGDAVRTLVIAGADGQFLPARSSIEGGTLLVWHEEIPAPMAVRYAWADNPEAANLTNADGIPAGPFRTDRGDRI
jgi:sialate O-acetylesterase